MAGERLRTRAATLRVGAHQLEAAWVGRRRGAGSTLVLLHEALGCVKRWKKWPRRLARATGCPVFMYSRAGHGGSSAVSGERPLDYLHREALQVLPAVLAAARVGPRILVGHSDGASIATLYGGGIDDPNLLGIVQLAPHFVVEPDGLAGIREIRESWETTNLPARLARYHGGHTDTLFRHWAGTWLDPAFATWDISSAMARVRVPTLLVQGDLDEYGTLQHFEIARRVARCRLEERVLSGVGHSPHLEAPETVTPLVAEFVAGLTSHPHP